MLADLIIWKQHNEARRFLRRQLIMSLRNDREQRWVGKCREMEETMAIGSSPNLYLLIRNTSSRKPSVSEVI